MYDTQSTDKTFDIEVLTQNNNCIWQNKTGPSLYARWQLFAHKEMRENYVMQLVYTVYITLKQKRYSKNALSKERRSEESHNFVMIFMNHWFCNRLRLVSGKEATLQKDLQ